MTTSRFFIQEIIYEISKHVDRECLTNLLSTCRNSRNCDRVFFDKYYVSFSKIRAPFLGWNYHYRLNEKQRSRVMEKTINKQKMIFCSKIRKLRVDSNETVCLNCLPDVTHLTFFYHFNNALDGLPHKLRSLIFEGRFDKPLPALPNRLTYLKLGFNFNHALADLPESLYELVVGGDGQSQFSQDLNLPENLKRFTVYWFVNCGFDVKVNFPPKLEYLQMEYYSNELIGLPETLRVLRLESYFRELVDLPREMEQIKLRFFEGTLAGLLNHVEKLTIDHYYLPIDFKGSVKTLQIRAYDLDNLFSLPHDLEYLYLDVNILECPLPELPPTLKTLRLLESTRIDHPLNLPEGVSLEFRETTNSM